MNDATSIVRPRLVEELEATLEGCEEIHPVPEGDPGCGSKVITVDSRPVATTASITESGRGGPVERADRHRPRPPHDLLGAWRFSRAGRARRREG